MIDPIRIRFEVWRYRAKSWLVVTDSESSKELFSVQLSTLQAAQLLAAGMPLIRTNSHGPACNQVR